MTVPAFDCVDNGKENGSYYNILGLYRVYIGIMEKKMEATTTSCAACGLESHRRS